MTEPLAAGGVVRSVRRLPELRQRLAVAVALSWLATAVAVLGLQSLGVWPDAWAAQTLCGLGVLGGFLWMGLGWVFQPLQRLSDALLQSQAPAQRGDSAVPPGGEVARLTQAIDRLQSVQHAWLEQQSRFIADASHQLRTPFAVLRTQLQGLMSAQLDPGVTLPRMLATVDRSAHLTRQLLSRAKVDQLIDKAQWVEVDLQKVAQDVATEFAPLLARKRLEFSLDAVPIVLQTDPWLLGELLRNLLSNAIHHAPKGSALGVVIRRLPGEAEMIVWDNAGGVDESLRDRLFKPFESAAGGTGIGLGLSICQQIAQSMSAQVGLYNRVQDQRVIGLDAVVRWPVQAPVEVSERQAEPAPPKATEALPVWFSHPGRAL